MRGIEMILHEGSDFEYDVLSLLLPFGIENFNWYAAHSFLYDTGIKNADINPGLVSVLDLEEIINEKRYMIDGLILMAYPIGPITVIPKTYEEYLASDCQLVFINYDGYYVKIYSKDEDYINQVYALCSNKPDFEVVQYKTDENDGRTGLYV